MNASTVRKEPITLDRIVDVSLRIAEAEGADAVTMRKVAAALQTGPASLYAHVRNKAELDEVLIGELCARVVLPEPDPARWHAQFHDVCSQVRDQYLRYPGISRAALEGATNSLDTLRISEGLLGILLAARIPPRDASWAIDAALLYIAAYALEAALRSRGDTEEQERTEIAERLAALPDTRFPHTVEHAHELTSGVGHDRFDFAIETILRGLAPTG